MTYLGEKMLGNFRPPIRERSKKRASAQQRREGNSKAYKALICKLRCCVTGQYGVDPHHLKSGPAKAERAAGRTATDRWLVPLSRLAHDELEFHKKGILEDRGTMVPRARDRRRRGARRCPLQRRQGLRSRRS